MSVLADLVASLDSGALKVVDLTQPLGPDTPVIGLPPMFASSPGVSIDVISRYDDRGPGWYWNTIRMGEHTGTHFDAPVHWISGKDFPDNRCDTIPPRRFVGPACVIDVTAEVAKDEDYLLMPEHVAAWETQHGRIPRGAWVLLRTGWSKRTDPEKFLNVKADGRDSTRLRRSCWRRSATSSASASRPWGRMQGRRARSIRRSPIMRRCTGTESSGWQACATSINCRRRARS